MNTWKKVIKALKSEADGGWSEKMLGLALGGGTYRGVAHLGVLKVFEEEGLKPGFLSGTSSGGLAAVFYAFGILLHEI